jgi:hypothetical protein
MRAGRGALAAAAALIAAALPAPGRPQAGPPSGFEFVARFTVPASVAWTDTGLNVSEGDVFTVRVSGNVSLQRGNPMAFCGPDGLNFKTVQQPIQDRNLGAFIARVAQLVSVSKDEETGEAIRNEIVRFVFIGSGATVRMPLAGRLYFGLNENIVGDDSGEFQAEVWRKTG